jgi:hypothetical protein
MATGRRHRFSNPRGAGRGSTGIGKVLPWLAIGGLLYLMAQNASKVKASSGAPAMPSAGSVGNNAGCNDFGTSGCWGC